MGGMTIASVNDTAAAAAMVAPTMSKKPIPPAGKSKFNEVIEKAVGKGWLATPACDPQVPTNSFEKAAAPGATAVSAAAAAGGKRTTGATPQISTASSQAGWFDRGGDFY
jgi:hypothetical protein